jgi:hypothetical protein
MWARRKGLAVIGGIDRMWADAPAAIPVGSGHREIRGVSSVSAKSACLPAEGFATSGAALMISVAALRAAIVAYGSTDRATAIASGMRDGVDLLSNATDSVSHAAMERVADLAASSERACCVAMISAATSRVISSEL